MLGHAVMGHAVLGHAVLGFAVAHMSYGMFGTSDGETVSHLQGRPTHV